ncbi:MAG: FecR domain-containing protein [Nitrospinales bacterium]
MILNFEFFLLIAIATLSAALMKSSISRKARASNRQPKESKKMLDRFAKTTLFLCALVIGFGAWTPLNSVSASEVPVGKVIGISGTVEFRAAGDAEPDGQQGGALVKRVGFTPWEKVAFHQPVYAKDEFRTSRGSRLKILFEDNSLVALGPGSEMKVASYTYQPERKFRQGAIYIAYGVSMYIVNSWQNHKKSFFKIVSPTANFDARGTHGFLSVSPEATLLANQEGVVLASSIDPSVKGRQLIGKMMKTSVSIGQPPSPSSSMIVAELSQIRNFVIGAIASEFPLPGEQASSALGDKLAATEGEAGLIGQPADSPAGPTGKPADIARPGVFSLDADIGPYGGPAEFAEIDEPFNAEMLELCEKRDEAEG